MNHSGVPDLETFLHVVDTLPAFNGEVEVSNTTVHFTFFPEPSSYRKLLFGMIALFFRRDVVRAGKDEHAEFWGSQ